MKGGGREVEEDLDGCSKRVRNAEHNTEGVERQDGCGKKRRIRSENWSASETLQMLELRRAVVETLTVKGADAWKQIAQQLADMNPESQARSAKQVAQRWDTLVKVYVSIEEECCESGRSYSEVIDERQKRCNTEYRQLWHELIAQGNPGKRRLGKAAVQADEAPGGLVNGASRGVIDFVRKFGEIAESFTEILDIIDRSISSLEGIRRSDENIVTGCNWAPEDDQGLETRASERGLEEQQVETRIEVAKATQAMFDRMQSISEAASASGPFCLEVDQKDWSMVMQKLSTISQKYQEPAREEVVGADVCVPSIQQQTNSARRSSHDHNNSTQRSSSSLYTKTRKRKEKSSSFGKRHGGSTQSPTFAGLLDIVPLSPESILRGWRDELWDLDTDQVVPVFQEIQQDWNVCVSWECQNGVE